MSYIAIILIYLISKYLGKLALALGKQRNFPCVMTNYYKLFLFTRISNYEKYGIKKEIILEWGINSVNDIHSFVVSFWFCVQQCT